MLRKENAALKDERAANQGTIATQTRIIEVERERGDFFKTAAEKGIKIGGNDIVLQQKYEEQIGMYKDENQRLRVENDKLRSTGNWKNLAFGLGGAAVGYYAGNRTCRF